MNSIYYIIYILYNAKKIFSIYKNFYIYLLTNGYKSVTIILGGLIIYPAQYFQERIWL